MCWHQRFVLTWERKRIGPNPDHWPAWVRLSILPTWAWLAFWVETVPNVWKYYYDLCTTYQLFDEYCQGHFKEAQELDWWQSGMWPWVSPPVVTSHPPSITSDALMSHSYINACQRLMIISSLKSGQSLTHCLTSI